MRGAKQISSVYLTMRYFCFLLCFCCSTGFAQVHSYKENKKLSAALANIVKQCRLDSNFNVGDSLPEQISLAVIDLKRKPKIAGVNMNNFIYPASVYKMYVAMEVLKQISEGKYSLQKQYIIPAHNDVDRSREIASDPRPLLIAGDTVTINYLLDLMITRSDNTASNCLIDIADRKNINETMLKNGWKGSEVTRKFLSRKLEDPGYATIKGTETCALHAADFMMRLANNELINPWVSLQLKALLGRQLDKSKLAAGLSPNTMFSHKTGWWSFYTHDVGIVEDEKANYVLAVFLPVKEHLLDGRMKLLAEKINALMRQ